MKAVPMKEESILLTVLMLILLSFCLYTSAEVKYLGTDTKTQGDWIGKYGESGAIIFCNKENHNGDLLDPYKPDEGQKLFKKGLINKISVAFHSDGYIEPLIPDLIEVGIDILQAVQPECTDVAELKEKYGDRLSFWGTMGTQSTMAFGTPEDVKKE